MATTKQNKPDMSSQIVSELLLEVIEHVVNAKQTLEKARTLTATDFELRGMILVLEGDRQTLTRIKESVVPEDVEKDVKS